MKFNEDSRVKIPAILHVTRLGFTYLPNEFAGKMQTFTRNLDKLFSESRTLETEIKQQLQKLQYESSAL